MGNKYSESHQVLHSITLEMKMKITNKFQIQFHYQLVADYHIILKIKNYYMHSILKGQENTVLKFVPSSGEYQSSNISVKSYLIFDAQIIYKITPSYQVVFGVKNISNHTNQSYGPYIGRTAYVEVTTNCKKVINS